MLLPVALADDPSVPPIGAVAAPLAGIPEPFDMPPAGIPDPFDMPPAGSFGEDEVDGAVPAAGPVGEVAVSPPVIGAPGAMVDWATAAAATPRLRLSPMVAMMSFCIVILRKSPVRLILRARPGMVPRNFAAGPCAPPRCSLDVLGCRKFSVLPNRLLKPQPTRCSPG